MSQPRVVNYVIRGLYRDSVQLMEVTDKVKRLPGVVDAAVLMGTTANKDSLKPLMLLTPEGEKAGPNDLIVILKATGNVDEIFEQVKKILFEVKTPTTSYSNIDEAVKIHQDIKYASISIPGKYVGDVAFKLIDYGINLFIFSDHVPIETEVELKKYAASKGLLVMGSEAGTAIISGVGFGFANKVEKGHVGIVASSGSGIQEFVSLLDSYGIGVSHAIGVGARDLTRKVGGIMTRKALQLLENDVQTKVVVLIAKQSDVEVVREILEQEFSKPLIVCLLGHPRQVSQHPQSPTLHGLALQVVSTFSQAKREEAVKNLQREVRRLKELVACEGGFPRAFYSGGSLAVETAYVWNSVGLTVHTNLSVPWATKLENPYITIKSTVIDYGSEEFTEGRPHPIIDHTLRNKRIVSELNSPETNSVVMDLIIGYGAPDNVVEKVFEEIGGPILKNRDKKMVVRLVGTDKDPQWSQTTILDKYGVVRPQSNTLAAAFTAACGLNDPSIMDTLAEELVLEVRR
ncbi:MAG: hypothetical protein QXQ48_05915 [Nitrososphaerota archaeon]